jgi:flagellin
MIINTNISSLTAQEAAKNTGNSISSSLEKLSTGLKINKASDDASGLAIADKLRTQASSLGQGISNANSASALIQIADKAMAEQSSILDTVKTKLIQASTDTTSQDGRDAIQADIKKLLTQLDNIAAQTNYNGRNLLDSAQTFTFQTGEDSSYQITATTAKASNTTELGGGTAGVAAATVAIADSVSLTQATIGAGNEVTATFTTGTEHKGTTISGKMDSISFDDNATTFTANDAATESILDSAVTAGLLTKDVNGVYTNTTADSIIALNNQSISITLDTVADGAVATIASESSFTIGNASNTEAITLANANTASNLGSVKDETNLSTEKAQSFMGVIDASLTQLNVNRSEFGSTQNQLESAIRNMSTTQTNILSAESIIRDVDYAEESANFNKQNIISQAGSYAISQANTVQQNVLKLLQ